MARARIAGIRVEGVEGLDCWCFLLLGSIVGRAFGIEFENVLNRKGFVD